MRCFSEHQTEHPNKESTWGSLYTVVSNSGKEVSVNVTSPGNLAKDILTQTRTAPANVNKLTITGGTLNEDDFATMCSTMTACFDIDMSAADCEVIPENAFNGRVTLKSIKLPENTKEIKAGAFKDCSILSSITLPDGLTIIGDEAFRNCDLGEIPFEGNLVSIGNYAFTDNYKLDNFNFGNALTTIGSNAFQNCYSLSSVAFAEGSLTIGSFTFENCYSLSSAKFAEGLTTIGEYTFRNCSSLEGISLPSTITSIGAYCFGKSSLSSIDLSRSLNLTIEHDAFSEDYNLAEIKFPTAITTIPQGLLWKCTSLTSLDLSQTNVTEIGDAAWEKCTALKTVKLPTSLQAIGSDVFAGDIALRTIVVPCTTPPTALSSAFTNVVTDECTIVIPSTAFYDYVLADNWSEFFNFDIKSDITFENPKDVTVTFATDDTPIDLMNDAMVFLPNGQTVKVTFACADGRTISNVLLDNNDVTDKLVDNVLTLEDFTGSSTIKVESSEATDKKDPWGVEYTLSEAGVGTLILPFDAELPTGLQAYTCVNTLGNDVLLSQQDKIEANTPVLIMGTPGTYTFDGVNVWDADSYSEGLLTGVFVSTEINSGYVLQNHDGVTAFYRVESDKPTTITPNHCYLTLGGEAERISLKVDNVTGIGSVTQDEQDGPSYDLNGRKTNAQRKGLFIRNNKKQIRK